MKIENTVEPIVSVKSIKAGEVFKDGECFFIKTNECQCCSIVDIDEDKYVCINLRTGAKALLTKDYKVTPVNAKLVIMGEEEKKNAD